LAVGVLLAQSRFGALLQTLRYHNGEKPQEKRHFPTSLRSDLKEGTLNETDVVPQSGAVPPLGVLGWFPVGESKTQIEKILAGRSEPEPVPDKEESREKKLEERKLGIDRQEKDLERREKEVEDRSRGLDDRERKVQEGHVEIQKKIEGVERRERELKERREEFERERENWPDMAEWKASLRAGLNSYLAMLA
jgi:hypothetical protein